MSVDLYEKVHRAAGTVGGRLRLGVTVWQLVAFVGVSLAAAAYLCGECCGQAARARSAATHLTLVGHDGAVRTVLFGRDGSMLSSVGANGTIAVWDLDGGLGHPLPPAGPGQGRCAAISPDGRLLAAGRADGPVALHDLQAREAHPLVDPAGATAGARCLAFAPDGRTLAVGQQDGRIALWDVATRRERPSSTTARPGHAEVVNSLAYSPDGGILASSGGDRTVRLWDAATGRLRREIAGQPGMFVALAFTPDSRILALADQQHPFVRLWDLAAGMERPALHGAEGAALALAISADGRTLAAADYHGAIHFWDLATGRLDRPRLVHQGAQSVAFSPDGHTVATGGFDGTIVLWDWPPPIDEDD